MTESNEEILIGVADEKAESASAEGATDDRRLWLPRRDGTAYRIGANAVDIVREGMGPPVAAIPAAKMLAADQRPTISLATSRGMLDLPAGLTLLIGGPSTGKTLALSHLAAAAASANVPVDHLLVDEPLVGPPPKGVRRALVSSEVDTGLAWMLSGIIRDGASLILVDSMRAIPYTTRGGAAEKGVVTAAFLYLTAVSNALAAKGLTAVAVLNPMDDSPDLLEAFLTRALSSVPCVIETRGSDGRAAVRGRINSRFAGRLWSDFQLGSASGGSLEAEPAKTTVLANLNTHFPWEI